MTYRLPLLVLLACLGLSAHAELKQMDEKALEKTELDNSADPDIVRAVGLHRSKDRMDQLNSKRTEQDNSVGPSAQVPPAPVNSAVYTPPVTASQLLNNTSSLLNNR